MAGKTKAELDSLRRAGKGEITSYHQERRKVYDLWVDAATSMGNAYDTAHFKWKAALDKAQQQKAARNQVAASVAGLILGSAFSWLALGLKTKFPSVLTLASNEELNKALNDRILGDILDVSKAIAGKATTPKTSKPAQLKPTTSIGLDPGSFKANLFAPLTKGRVWFDSTTTDMKNELSDAWLLSEIVKDGKKSLTELEHATAAKIKAMLKKEHQDKAFYFREKPTAVPQHKKLSRLLERALWAAYIHQIHNRRVETINMYEGSSTSRIFGSPEDAVLERLVDLKVVRPEKSKKAPSAPEVWQPPIPHPFDNDRMFDTWDNNEKWQLWLWSRNYFEATKVVGIGGGGKAPVREPMERVAPVPNNGKKKRVAANRLTEKLWDASITASASKIRARMKLADAKSIFAAADSDAKTYSEHTIKNARGTMEHKKRMDITPTEIRDMKILLWYADIEPDAAKWLKSKIKKHDRGVVVSYSKFKPKS